MTAASPLGFAKYIIPLPDCEKSPISLRGGYNSAVDPNEWRNALLWIRVKDKLP